MKVYLVTGKYVEKGYVLNTTEDFSVYGVCSNLMKAMIIRHDIMKSNEKHNENETVSVRILNLDEPTDEYKFMMETD